MRLVEALKITGRPAEEPQQQVHLLCGFEPLHLSTFINAHARVRLASHRIAIRTGLYGDLEGNLQRAAQVPGEGAIAIVEWSDLDQRLGFRAAGGWGSASLEDLIAQASEKCSRLALRLTALAESMPLVVVGPTLPMPPLTHLPPVQSSRVELRLEAMRTAFLEGLAGRRGVKVLSAATLATASPLATRHDIKMELAAGFPYTLQHADSLAEQAVACLFPSSPKKGLITDLDQTFWKGILGDVGVAGISWSLDAKSHVHALYQQMLASLAEAGVLLAIVSKNEPDIVADALARPDLLVKPEQMFPVETSWGAKSDAVSRVLATWNVGPDSVVFVDDSPMELAEVAERHPGVECLQFHPDDPAAVLTLLHHLRSRFGKDEVRAEDKLRLDSLRGSAKLEEEKAQAPAEDFLARLKSKVRFESSDANDRRAFELVNKTNQFNLNGARYTEAEWKTRAEQPGHFLVKIAYEDRFGPLGHIAVIGGALEGDRCRLDVWVMSCRAFSRQIEYQTLRQIFQRTGVTRILLSYQQTERNVPLQGILKQFFPEGISAAPLELTRDAFDKTCPTLFQEVTDTWTLSRKN